MILGEDVMHMANEIKLYLCQVMDLAVNLTAGLHDNKQKKI